MGLLRMWLYDHIINHWMPNKRGIWNHLFFLTLGIGAVLVAALLIRNGSQEKIWEKEALRALEPDWVETMYVESIPVQGEDRAKTEQLLGQAVQYARRKGLEDIVLICPEELAGYLAQYGFVKTGCSTVGTEMKMDLRLVIREIPEV